MNVEKSRPMDLQCHLDVMLCGDLLSSSLFCTLSHPILPGSNLGPLRLLTFIQCVLWTLKNVVQ
jgi:hypothetical protein